MRTAASRRRKRRFRMAAVTCGRCGGDLSGDRATATRCGACAAYSRAATKKYLDGLRAAGKCVRCRQPLGGLKEHCQECRKRIRGERAARPDDQKARNADYHKARKERLKAAGICRDCRRASVDGDRSMVRCLSCLNKRLGKSKALPSSRLARPAKSGYACGRCGVPLDAEGGCVGCVSRRIEALVGAALLPVPCRGCGERMVKSKRYVCDGCRKPKHHKKGPFPCARCGKNEVKHPAFHCESCRADPASKNHSQRSYKRKIEEGKCYLCGERAVEGKTQCGECLAVQKEKARVRREEMRAAGVCISCGKRNATTTGGQCQPCADRGKENRLKRRWAAVGATTAAEYEVLRKAARRSRLAKKRSKARGPAAKEERRRIRQQEKREAAQAALANIPDAPPYPWDDLPAEGSINPRSGKPVKGSKRTRWIQRMRKLGIVLTAEHREKIGMSWKDGRRAPPWSRDAAAEDGFIYCFELPDEPGWVMIGYTKDLTKRAQSYELGCEKHRAPAAGAFKGFDRTWRARRPFVVEQAALDVFRARGLADGEAVNVPLDEVVKEIDRQARAFV